MADLSVAVMVKLISYESPCGANRREWNLDGPSMVAELGYWMRLGCSCFNMLAQLLDFHSTQVRQLARASLPFRPRMRSCAPSGHRGK
eukprot:460076-Amphidinium_carterae.1